MYEFDYRFKGGADDVVYCALLAPYSYTKLQSHLYSLK
jgi:hypothetical protein